MAAPALSTPFQPYVYQSPQAACVPFQILGGEAQIVQIMLKFQEKILAKPGSMCYMSGMIQMENILPPENAGVNVWQLVFGRSPNNTMFTNVGTQDGYIGIAAPSLSRILPIDLAMFGGEIMCQPDAYLCSINDVAVVPTIMRRARTGIFGGEGFLMHKLTGQGLAFIAVGGSIVQKNLAQGEVIIVEAGCVIAMTTSIDMQIRHLGGMRRTVFGMAGSYAAHLTGPGVVFIQSLPFHRLASKIARSVAAPSLRDNPRFLVHVAVSLLVVYVIVLYLLILTEI
ncbi:hypothetical protein GOP47_0004302 [Adiantum capillus-veneris]|uniref:Altered inheritance of mitochondria protein 24, mitochondrial n=1 Tax=Adiantum capillus-veneris TaxID=13818 RepID=A0A9D4V7B1_ADICA|nr:hypothetical protein GOP47_0004302 [Adiantum capillus-veneris]